MSSFKLLVAGALIAATTACGFEPIAAPGRPDAGVSEAELALSSLKISVYGYSEDERFLYTLRKELTRFVDVGAAGADRLSLNIHLDESGLAIQQDDTITRLNFTATAKYRLSSGDESEPVTGTLRSITATNATSSQFSTAIASRDAYERLAVDIARKMLMILRVKNSGMMSVRGDAEG